MMSVRNQEDSRLVLSSLTRNQLIDVIRGLSILLMALDHVLAVVDPSSPWRHLTRAAMPGFMVISGYLGAGAVDRRYWDVVMAAVISWPLAVFLELALVHILMVFVLVYPLLRLPIGGLILVASLGLLQAHNWPIHTGGYQPGYVFAFLAVGRLAALAGYQAPNPPIRSPFVSWLGRRPLQAYVGHLIILAICVFFFESGLTQSL